MHTLNSAANSIGGLKEFEKYYLADSPERWLLVCGKVYEFLPQKVKDMIEKYKGNCVVFDEFSSNPTYETILKGLDRFRAADCSLIVAIGGGSAIDVAKCIKLFYGVKYPDSYLKNRSGVDYKKIQDIGLIAIPTTAGTGSESTKYAVFYYNGEKQSIEDEIIIPDIAILEPTVLKTLPVYQKKCTLLDALCQGIESWWSLRSTDESRKYSEMAVENIILYYKKYIYDNDDEAVGQIMLAANYAGRAINIAQTTAAHAMSYKITSLFKIPHGHAVAICLPFVWKYIVSHISDCVDSRGEKYLKSVFEKIPIDVDWFEELMKELDMPAPVSQNRDKDIEILTSSVNPVRLKNNPIALSTAALHEMYERII